MKPKLMNISLIDNMPNTKRKYFSYTLLKQILSLYKRHEKTIIDYPWFGLYFLPLRIFLGKRFEMRELDIEFLRFKGFRKWYWTIMYLFEYLVYLCADRVYFISVDDKRTAQKYFHIKEGKCIVKTYQPDISRFFPETKYRQEIRKKLGFGEHELFILFFGNLSYKPNIEAIQIIKSEIIPRLNQYGDFNYKIAIFGKNPPDLKDEKIIYAGFVKNIEHYVQSCDVMINPIISGGGVKTKAVEALACERNVVSTSTGAMGIDIELYKKYLYIIENNNWDGFVDRIVTLKNNGGIE
jgi:glycosyltransferase involved in cell wall biosynthesis